jgi:hypothetical protein
LLTANLGKTPVGIGDTDFGAEGRRKVSMAPVGNSTHPPARPVAELAADEVEREGLRRKLLIEPA